MSDGCSAGGGRRRRGGERGYGETRRALERTISPENLHTSRAALPDGSSRQCRQSARPGSGWPGSYWRPATLLSRDARLLSSVSARYRFRFQFRSIAYSILGGERETMTLVLFVGLRVES
jgi:hypothetical protein